MEGKISRRRLFLLETAALLLACGGQAVMRTVYRSSGNSFWAGIFGEANSSIWEQVKVVYFSYLFSSILEFFAAGVPLKRYFCAKTAGCALIAAALPVFLYACAPAAGRLRDRMDGAGAFAAAALAFYLSYRLILSGKARERHWPLWGILFFILLFLFLTLTVSALPAGIFMDPKTGGYGLSYRFHAAYPGTFYT